MIRTYLVFVLTFSSLLLSSCKRPFEYSVLEVRPLAKDLNTINIEKIQSLKPKDHFTFFFISDTQVAYDQLESFVKMVNKLPEDSVSFILNGGDVADYGTNFEYNYYYDNIKKLKTPIVTIIGNHDMLGNGRELYKQYFGSENFSFSYGETGFILFNSNSREVAFDGSLPNLSWVENEIKSFENKRNIIYLSHITPDNFDYDQSKKAQHGQLVSSAPNSRLSLHGHTHSYHETEVFNDGIPYVTTPTLKRRSFVRVIVQGDNVSYNQEFF